MNLEDRIQSNILKKYLDLLNIPCFDAQFRDIGVSFILSK